MAARSLALIFLIAFVACTVPGASAGRRLLQSSPGPLRGALAGITSALGRDNITIAKNGPIDATIKLDGKLGYAVLGQSGAVNVTVPKLVFGDGAAGSKATITTDTNKKPLGGSLVAAVGVDVAFVRPLAGSTVNINHGTAAGVGAGTTTGAASIKYSGGNKATTDLSVGGSTIVQAGVSDSTLTGGKTIGASGAQILAVLTALGK